MKTYKEFLSESVNISEDFNGNLYVNSQPEQQQVGESYAADITWKGSIYRLELTTQNGIPSTSIFITFPKHLFNLAISLFCAIIISSNSLL